MIESIVALILGAFVMWSLVVRYKTIDSDQFIKNTQITVFIFASFAIGLSLMNMEKAIKISGVLAHHEFYKFFLYASPALFPIILKIVQGTTFSNAWELNATVILLPIALFFTLEFFLLPHNSNLFLTVYLTLFATVLGFMHSVLGSIISSFNIALVVANFFKHRIFNIDLNSLFDILEHIGIGSPLFKWMIVAASTLIGLRGCFNSQWLRDSLR
jgi:hypothetical protein